ncbi:putative spc97 spc98 family protein [Golovinomyces cichoracearum]|uniref:Spindle pole body component n=1 Tax=Golovinomyces cichoracearum TaxID=62708 RepID=A0A420IPR6_9PEZI|nr:putative spc97 spc98 family protein [Golovinomyces cichoracearum]
MSHISRIEALIEELIGLIVPSLIQSDPIRLVAQKNSAILFLRHHNFALTNQFDVKNQLDGLDEKLRVYGRDNLADAICERRTRLDQIQPTWTPEILQLLLELSDRPASNSKVEHLETLREPQLRAKSRLRWSNITLEDPSLQEESIWENVDFADDSSDDESSFREKVDESDENIIRSINDDGAEIHNSQRIYDVGALNYEGLERLRVSQFWQKVPNVHGVRIKTIKKSITELEAAREVLFMFGGYPTSLFKLKSEVPMAIEASSDYALKNVSHSIFMSFLKKLTTQGSAVMRVRSWAQLKQANNLIQFFKLSILERLDKFDTLLSKIHHRLVAPLNDLSVSLLSIHQEVESPLRLLLSLSEITDKIEKYSCEHAFRYLEMLYDLICTSQIAGDDTTYEYMGKLFFNCFHVYLQPIKSWIEEGKLWKDEINFFVCETTCNIELSLLWESKFKLRRTEDGTLHVPKFLRPATNRIFNTGKSIVVLKHLDRSDLLLSIKKGTESKLDFETVCNPENFKLASFAEIFDTAFDTWVCGKHQHAASILKDTLFNSCGLHTSFDALSHIYFLADGSIGTHLTNAIFNNLDMLRTWNDKFTLTEHAQSSFASLESVSVERLRMSVPILARKYQDIEICRKSVKALAAVELKYQLSWPIQIVVSSRTMISYQKIFIFLIQVRRSFYCLTRETNKEKKNYYDSNCDEEALYYSLRMRLLWFTQTIYYYLTSLVLEPCSQKMKVDLKAAEDVDMMIKVHLDYINRCVDQTLLGSNLELIYNTILKVLDLGIELDDAQTRNAVMRRSKSENQLVLMESSTADLGIPMDQRHNSLAFHQKYGPSQKSDYFISEDEIGEVGTDFSVSPQQDNEFKDLLYVSQLRSMKVEFYRLVRFISRGLQGVSRASIGEEARLWDTLSDMLESGLRN